MSERKILKDRQTEARRDFAESRKQRSRQEKKANRIAKQREKFEAILAAGLERQDDMALRLSALRRQAAKEIPKTGTYSSPYAETSLIEDWREQD